MDKFYVINDKPSIPFMCYKATIYGNKEAAFTDFNDNKWRSDKKIKVYEVRAFGSLMTDGLHFKEVFDYESKSKNNK